MICQSSTQTSTHEYDFFERMKSKDPVAELAQVQSLGTRPKPIRERKWTCVAQQKDNTREEKRRGHVSKISPNRQSNSSSSTQITISDSLLL